jgi:hypothetical protein
MKLTRFSSLSQTIFELELLADIHSLRIPRAKIRVLSLITIVAAELAILWRLVSGVVTDSDHQK